MPTCVIRITDENGVTVSERACCSTATRFISPPPLGRQSADRLLTVRNNMPQNQKEQPPKPLKAVNNEDNDVVFDCECKSARALPEIIETTPEGKAHLLTPPRIIITNESRQ